MYLTQTSCKRVVLLSLSTINCPYWAMNSTPTDTQTDAHALTHVHACSVQFSVQPIKAWCFPPVGLTALKPHTWKTDRKVLLHLSQTKCMCVCARVCVTVFSAGRGVDSGQAEELPDFQNKTWLHSNTTFLCAFICCSFMKHVAVSANMRD